MLNLQIIITTKILTLKRISEMRVSKIYFSLIIFLFTSLSTYAQTDRNNGVRKDSLLNKITDIESRVREVSTKDTMRGFSAPLKIDTAYANQIQEANLQPIRDKNGLIIMTPDWVPFSNNVSFRDTVIFEPAYLPVIFEGKILPRNIDFRSKDDTTSGVEPFYLISPDSTFAPQLKRVEHMEDMRRLYYTSNPQRIQLDASAFKGTPVIKEAVVEQRNPFKELITAENPIEFSKPEIEKIKIKPVYWIINGKHELQASQNSFSEKWGSDNNFNLYSNQVVNANYKKKKIAFNNLFEWRLNLQQITGSKKDDNDGINIIDDYLRTYSTFSIEAFKKWSYSTNLEMKTPLFEKKKVGDRTVVQRAILSPFELNLGLGMRYKTETVSKQDKYRKFNVAADLSVLSLNYKFVGDNRVDEKQFGIEEGDKSKTEYGSTFNVNLSYSRNRYTSFTSRLKYFTNYEKVYVEFENSLNFALNRYLSTTLYLYVKYDDSLTPENRDPKYKFFNYNEMLRFGLTYTW